MSKTSKSRKTALRKYRVLYAVARSEYYEIEAANEAEASGNAYFEGEFADHGETTNVDALEVEEIEPKASSRPITKRLPPDPEGKNDDRAEWAASALRDFQRSTRTDDEDALSDLLGDLMHWSDRNGFDFDAELSRARMHYAAETTSPDSGVEG